MKFMRRQRRRLTCSTVDRAVEYDDRLAWMRARVYAGSVRQSQRWHDDELAQLLSKMPEEPPYRFWGETKEARTEFKTRDAFCTRLRGRHNARVFASPPAKGMQDAADLLNQCEVFWFSDWAKRAHRRMIRISELDFVNRASTGRWSGCPQSEPPEETV